MKKITLLGSGKILLNLIPFIFEHTKYDEILDVKNDLKEKNIIPDIIINNAAGNFLCPLEHISPNGWNRIIDIVLNGSFNIYHVFGKTLIDADKSGVFLNISTTYAENSSALVIPSACAKAGVDNLMKGLTLMDFLQKSVILL